MYSIPSPRLAHASFDPCYNILLSFLSKVCVTFPIVYHYFGAVRHVAWDYVPDYLENTDVEKSSYALFGASTVISLGAMFL